MGSSPVIVALLCALVGPLAAIQTPQTVFLDKQQASAVISRQKRAVDSAAGAAPTLEAICMEKVCNYDEAWKVFQDSYRTDIFWSVYIDGDQCAEQPCMNGAMCSDSVGGYDCVCKAGFTGVHCEDDRTLCTLEKDKGCAQFCQPDYTFYRCSCARGWRVSRTDPHKCEPAVTHPCGKVNSLSQWRDRQISNSGNNYNGLSCRSNECPWQALLKSGDSAGFCSGVILKENLVLTTAQCANKYGTFQVAVGKLGTSDEAGQQVRYAKVVHVHPRYVKDRTENDLAVVELREPISFKTNVIAACLPERDFADSMLMTGNTTAVITGWKESEDGSAFRGGLTLNHLAYQALDQCVETHPTLMTNKMGCTVPRANADCSLSPGSPLLTLHRDVFFLTGVVSKPPEADCANGYVFQKVSRHLKWLQSLMSSR